MNQFRRVLLQYIFFADALFIYMAKIGLTYSIFITLFVLVLAALVRFLLSVEAGEGCVFESLVKKSKWSKIIFI